MVVQAVTPTLGRLRQKDCCEFKFSLDCLVRSCLYKLDQIKQMTKILK